MVTLLLLCVLTLSSAAQRVHNNVATIKRRLGKLLIQSISNESCYHATKDLLRLVSNRQIQIKAFGSVTIDMSLPPTCIIMFTSYTVIALQFNNVL
ncbi:unnamed protein product [Parnassius mnemosyne]|uniref:Uncharacterized protein n=1 Tax=Parnassius mnemosyne TaxID=213953 RepID=A0AAV1LNW6_9NEOP